MPEDKSELTGEQIERIHPDVKPFDYGKTKADGQHERYPSVKTDGQQFIRPVRRSYMHKACGTVTTMAQKIAETYAVNPKFYGATYCAGCKGHFPVGERGDFFWVDNPGTGKTTEEKVGT